MRLTHYDEHKKRWQINNNHGAVMIDELNYAVGEAVDKLAAYEDADEQGLLVRLPCKVGDTFYALESRCDGAGDCDNVVECKQCNDYKQQVTEWRIYSLMQAVSAIKRLGKTVFLTREEAEAALKGENIG